MSRYVYFVQYVTGEPMSEDEQRILARVREGA